jgi:hypothetical protein
METKVVCTCNNQKFWTTGGGNSICGNCGNLDPSKPIPDCLHVRNKVSIGDGFTIVTCSGCGLDREITHVKNR